MEHIFEVVDATDDERYYSLGVFLTEAGAMSLTDGAEPPYNDDDPDAVTIEVRRRLIGFHPHAWDKIAEKTWVRSYADNAPDWTPQPVKLFCQNAKPTDGGHP